MASDEYQNAASATPYLVASALMGGMTMFAPGLYIKKATSAVALITILSGLLTLAFSYWLIILAGVTGAAAASWLGNMFAFILMMVFSQKHYYIQYSFNKVTIAALFSVIIIAASSLLKDVNFLIKLLALTLFSAFLIFFGLIDKNKIISLVDYFKKARLLPRQK